MIRPKVWTLLVLIALVALPLGVAVTHYRAEQRAIAQLRRLGASVELEPGRLLGRWWPKVVGVEAHGHEFSDEGLILLAGLPDLRGLSLLGTPTTDSGLAHLVRLRGLEVIYLEDTEVTDAGLNHFTKMSGLSELRVSGGRITEAGLDRLRRTSPKLKTVQGSFL
jgi:hypothetical protein